MEHEGQGFMSLTLAFHRVRTGPSKGCGVNLCHFVSLAGSSQGKHSVSKHGVWESFILQHPVIRWEATGESRVETFPHPALSGHDHRAFSTVQGDHPPCGQGLWVNRRYIARSNMSIKACVDTQDHDFQGQDLVEVFVIRDVNKVGAQR
jgi:hypothetical protein